jgi:hypothetical protein
MPEIIISGLYEYIETSYTTAKGERITYPAEAPIKEYVVFDWIVRTKVNHGDKWNEDWGHVIIDTYTGYAIGNQHIPAPKQFIDLWKYFKFEHVENGLYVAKRQGVRTRIQSNKKYRVVGIRDGVNFDTGPILAEKTPHHKAK